MDLSVRPRMFEEAWEAMWAGVGFELSIFQSGGPDHPNVFEVAVQIWLFRLRRISLLTSAENFKPTLQIHMCVSLNGAVTIKLSMY